MDSSEDFELDPFNYQPLKRRKLVSKSQSSVNKTKIKLIKSPARSQKIARPKTNKKVLNKLLHKAPINPIQIPLSQIDFSSLEACPYCQVPLKLLRKPGQVSANVHVSDCQDDSRGSNVECPDGARCRSNVVAHYSRYTHHQLSKARNEVVDVEDAEDDVPLLNNCDDINILNSTEIGTSSSKPVLCKKPYSSPIKATRRFEDKSAKKKPYFSPIKAIRRLNPNISRFCGVCENSFDVTTLLNDHICLPPITPSVSNVAPMVTTERQRKFLKNLEKSEECSGNESHVEPVANNNEVADDDLNLHMSFSQDDLFNDSLGTQIDKVVENISKETAKDDEVIRKHQELMEKNQRHSTSKTEYQITVPDTPKTNNQMPGSQKTSNHQLGNLMANKVKVNVGGGKELDISLEPTDDEMEKENKKNNSTGEVSPIKVSADKDSQEMELLVNIDPAVHCTRLKVKIPLKKTESGHEKPLELSASYVDVEASNIDSPTKQAKMTEYFGVKKGQQNPNAKSEWNKVFSKPCKSTPVNKGKYIHAEYESSQEEAQKVKKVAPFFKTIRGTNLSVDGFNWGDLPGVKYYLLSHYHLDHYMGLSKKWKHPVICSSLTKRLLQTMLKVPETIIKTIDPGQTMKIGDCVVTALDAHHCPGAIMFVIQLTSGQTILHTGDFRAIPQMETKQEVGQFPTIDQLYLDTTYCKPIYDFPPQGEVVERTLQIVLEFIRKRPDTIVMVGAYDIGKEKIFKKLIGPDGLNCEVWGDKHRNKIWRTLQDGEITRKSVEIRINAQVNVISNSKLNFAKLGMEFDQIRRGSQWKHVLGVKPTGWTHSRGESPRSSLENLQVITKGDVSLLEVPYSEHSSFSELKRFVKFLKLSSEADIIDTVSRRSEDRKRTKEVFKEWIS